MKVTVTLMLRSVAFYDEIYRRRSVTSKTTLIVYLEDVAST